MDIVEAGDYYPHGGILPGTRYVAGGSMYRYGYQGQERDVESGLTNFELRQYDPRLGRWNNPDPYGQHHSPYLAMSNNPVNHTDPNGGWDDPITLAMVGMEYMYNLMFSSANQNAYAAGSGNGTSSGTSIDGYGVKPIQGATVKKEMWPTYVLMGPDQMASKQMLLPDDAMGPVGLRETKTYALPSQGSITQGSTPFLKQMKITVDFMKQHTVKAYELDMALETVNANYKAFNWIVNKSTKDMYGDNVGYQASVDNAVVTTAAIAAGPLSQEMNAMKNVASIGNDIALGLNDDLFNFARAKNFKTYRDFSVGLQKEKILSQMLNESNRLHFNMTGFSKFRFSKFNPDATIVSHGNITNWELHNILSNPSVLKRTTFYRYSEQGYYTIPNPFK